MNVYKADSDYKYRSQLIIINPKIQVIKNSNYEDDNINLQFLDTILDNQIIKIINIHIRAEGNKS
jgi:hypothetical protein